VSTAILGAIGYSMDGFYKQGQKRRHEHHEHHTAAHMTVEEQVAASWLVQGLAALQIATEETKDNIVQKWYEADQTAKIAREEKLAHRPSARIKTWSTEMGSHRTGLFSSHRRSSSRGSLGSLKEDGNSSRGSLVSPKEDSVRNSSIVPSLRSDGETASLRSVDTMDTAKEEKLDGVEKFTPTSDATAGLTALDLKDKDLFVGDVGGKDKVLGTAALNADSKPVLHPTVTEIRDVV
jgi:hypothetical protein